MRAQPLRAVHTIAGLRWAAGGVSRSVPGLCEALARGGTPTVLVSQRPAGIAPQELALPCHEGLEVRLLPGIDLTRLRVSYTPGVFTALRGACTRDEGDACIVHDHGVWLHMNHAVARACGKLGLQRVVSPRGMLQDWSMGYRAWRKKLAWAAYQCRDLRTARAFSATSEDEAAAIRGLGFGQPIAIIPNGVAVPASKASFDPSGERVALFISRLHPKKGVLDLVEAWSRVRPRDWTLVIAGPDEGGHARLVQAAARRSPCAGRIRVIGAVEGVDKDRAFASAQLFILPSYSENFGIVVGEALAHGLPVITTTATPWSVLRDRRCGWWVGTGADTLEAALREATSLDAATLEAMGGRGRQLVAREFSWDAAAARHVAFYEWLLGRTPRPPFVA